MVFSSWSKKLNLQKQKIRQQILNDPYYRFQSLEEIAIAAELGIKIEVNQASIDDLLRLPGLSIHQARILVELINMGVEILSIEDMAAALGIPQQRLNPFASILAFSYYDSDSLLRPQKINPNQATLEQLQTIILDSIMAEAIINNRQNYGDYRNIIDLQKRLNFDSKTVSKLMHYLQF